MSSGSDNHPQAEPKLDEPTTPRVLTILSCVLEKLVACNDQLVLGLAQLGKSLNAFDGVKAPRITILNYIERIYKYTNCSPSCFVVGYVHIDRLVHRYPNSLVVSLNVHRLLVTCVMVASKILDHVHYNNAFYARIGGVTSTELNKLEVKLLFLLDFGVICRHPHSLICDKCSSQAATVRCIEDKLSLCEDCDWNGNSCSGVGHHRLKLNFYTGCPSLAEFSKIWSSILESPQQTTSSFGSAMATNENSNMDCAIITDLRPPETDDLCDSLDMDDIGLSFDSSYEMFGNSQGQPRYNYEDGGISSLLMEKNLSVTLSNSTHIESAFEASSSGHIAACSRNLMQAVSSANCVLMNPAAACNRSSMGLGFPNGQLPSTISLTLQYHWRKQYC
ncbi:unnamed protein product [Fraxinus pennsylvanica]|uniref:Cyclin n=1 Tax=Fraxinus pennsylvanica TaxID=56036 RepID=A0AAD1ZNV4_9LAMI|nr:unnamed protein product [Fraxinus pennsylvanica]